jgi:lipid-A-disaccharide synthase
MVPDHRVVRWGPGGDLGILPSMTDLSAIPDPPESRQTILFTAFEPSADAQAAPVIRALRAREPGLRLVAWGGPRMEEAGAEIIERTSEDGVMGLAGFLKVFEMKRTIDRIDAWAVANRVDLHVPIDSPSANFPICKRLRGHGSRTVHLIAPKVWAWGRWRVRKLQRWSDHVLCNLPFEEAWFRDKGIAATFIGHPVMARSLDEEALAVERRNLPQGTPKILILPGSRSGEIKGNLVHQLDAFAEIRRRHPEAVSVILAANERIEAAIRERFDPLPPGVSLERDRLDAAISWADLALATSGTVSLDLTRHACPMIGSYAIPQWQTLVTRLMLRIPFKLLPNIVAGREVVPEFVPYARRHGATPIIETALPLLDDPAALAAMKTRLEGVRAMFDGHDPAIKAADGVLDVLHRDH